ncbi:hypothetical protein ACP275_14G120300 [Erythranthe tilingii]
MMSERMKQSITENSGKSRRIVQSYQPVWMAHWMRTRDDDSSNTLEASTSFKEPEKLNSTRTFKFANESLVSSSKSSKNEGMPTSLTKHGRKTDEWNHLELGKSEIVPYCNPPQKKLPNRVRNLETVRICTTVDSVQMTHSLLITKKTDVNLSKESDIRRTMGLIKMKGSTSPFFGGIKLQEMSSFSNSEGTKNEVVNDCKVIIRNESSADTDTMDMAYFRQEKLNSGANSTPSTKGFNIDSNSSPRIDVSSSRRVKHRGTKTGLPDINLQLPALPAVASSSENVGPTSSRTQSLEMETLIAQAEQPKPKSNDSSEADPTNRWVKRLKLNSTNSSAQGTKSSSLAEKSSHRKMKKLFGSILESGSTTSTSEPTSRKHHSNKNEEEKGKRLLLSHAWIKRWRKNRLELTETKPETVVICEPNSSKLSLDDLQKKQFPSIAAMALMGKAMNGLKSCEHQKRGPLTVWNTKTF